MKANNLTLGLLCVLLASCGNGATSNTKDPNQTSNDTPDTTPKDETVDEQEPNNSSKQPNTIDLKKAYRGTIGPVSKPNNKGDEDYYLIDNSEKTRLKISLGGVPNMDLSLVLFNDKLETV